MKKNRLFAAATIVVLLTGMPRLHAQPGLSRNPLPTSHQLKWHENNYYLFMHFGPNTFTNQEWGTGQETTAVFRPEQLDCSQWVRVAKEAGAKGIIITAKHHDGFCLWPSKYSTHTVRESGFNRDVLAKLSTACKKAGLLFGVYLSPWDRNHPDYGTDRYNDVYVNMLKEIFSNYGPIWELWWDGANGEGPNGKQQVYDWKRYEATVRSLSPQTIIFSDIGPDCRWVGNEKGYAGETNWNLLDTAGYTRGIGAPAMDTLNRGNYRGSQYIPAESDVSIRPGWFYHQSENDQVKTPGQLMDIYLKTVGRGANLLLNVPPDNNGLIHEKDIAALMGFKKSRSIFEKKDLLKGASVRISEPDKSAPDRLYSWYHILKSPVWINGLILQEDLQYGQKISEANINVSNRGETVYRTTITTIGSQRIILFPQPVEAGEVSVVITGSKGRPVMKAIRAF